MRWILKEEMFAFKLGLYEFHDCSSSLSRLLPLSLWTLLKLLKGDLCGRFSSY